MANSDNGGGFVLGLFIGGVIGALAGLLLAPKSGSETRADLVEMGDTWRTRADEMAAEMRVRGLPDVGGRVGPAVDSLRERGSSTIGAVREAGTGVVASARESVSAVRSRIGTGNGAIEEAASPAEGAETSETSETSEASGAPTA